MAVARGYIWRSCGSRTVRCRISWLCCEQVCPRSGHLAYVNPVFFECFHQPRTVHGERTRQNSVGFLPLAC